MRYWFFEFLDTITENISKTWVENKKKKNVNYKEPENLRKRIRLIIKSMLTIALGLAIIMFISQTVQSIF